MVNMRDIIELVALAGLGCGVYLTAGLGWALIVVCTICGGIAILTRPRSPGNDR